MDDLFFSEDWGGEGEDDLFFISFGKSMEYALFLVFHEGYLNIIISGKNKQKKA